MKEKIKKYWWVIIIASLTVSSFYWFQWRPSVIRKECMQKVLLGKAYDDIKTDNFQANKFVYEYAWKEGSLSKKMIDELYENCIRVNGLGK